MRTPLWFALVASGALAMAATPVPHLPIPVGAAVILNTGSTNAPGYRIVIVRGGSVRYSEGTHSARALVPAVLAEKFFAALSGAMPLDALLREECMKSASFGTSLYVWYAGRRSPDLDCSGDARGRALASEARAVAHALGLGESVKRPLMPNEPRRILPAEPSPTPSRS